MIYLIGPTQIDLTSNFFILCTNMEVDIHVVDGTKIL